VSKLIAEDRDQRPRSDQAALFQSRGVTDDFYRGRRSFGLRSNRRSSNIQSYGDGIRYEKLLPHESRGSETQGDLGSRWAVGQVVPRPIARGRSHIEALVSPQDNITEGLTGQCAVIRNGNCPFEAHLLAADHGGTGRGRSHLHSRLACIARARG